MQFRTVVFSFALLSMASCKSEETHPSPAAASASASTTAPSASVGSPTQADKAARATKAREEAWAPPATVPPEYSGALTVARITEAKSLLPAPKLAPKVMPLLLGQLGKPTQTKTGTHPLLGKEQKRYAWAAKSGTTCAVYRVVEQPNALEGWPPALAEDLGSGTFEKPKSAPNASDSDDYAACLAAVGEGGKGVKK